MNYAPVLFSCLKNLVNTLCQFEIFITRSQIKLQNVTCLFYDFVLAFGFKSITVEVMVFDVFPDVSQYLIL